MGSSYAGSFKSVAARLSVLLSTKFNRQVAVDAYQVEIAQGIIAKSSEVKDTVLPYVYGVLKTTGLKPSCAIEEGPCKLLERMIEKSIYGYDGDVTKVPDPHRLRIWVDSADDVETLREYFVGQSPQYYKKDPEDHKCEPRLATIMDAHPHNHIRCDEFEDYFHVPSSSGRVAIHVGLSVRVPGKQNVPFETQILHKRMLEAEKFSRNNYTQSQELRRKLNSLLEQGVLESDPQIQQYRTGIAAYNNSSQERYLADSINNDLIRLRRIDLQHVVKPTILAQTITSFKNNASNEDIKPKARALAMA